MAKHCPHIDQPGPFWKMCVVQAVVSGGGLGQARARPCCRLCWHPGRRGAGPPDVIVQRDPLAPVLPHFCHSPSPRGSHEVHRT